MQLEAYRMLSIIEHCLNISDRKTLNIIRLEYKFKFLSKEIFEGGKSCQSKASRKAGTSLHSRLIKTRFYSFYDALFLTYNEAFFIRSFTPKCVSKAVCIAMLNLFFRSDQNNTVWAFVYFSHEFPFFASAFSPFSYLKNLGRIDLNITSWIYEKERELNV